ncbi:hypothetical protein CL629_00005, partial [bacterium]|nr:hypothetical protein [bacterium]
MWRNERTLYKRPCDATKKDIISIFSKEAPYTIYSREAWWSDDWDPLEHGQEYDFSRTFFEQFSELMERVPLPAIFNGKCINSDYCNHCGELKNCYL